MYDTYALFVCELVYLLFEQLLTTSLDGCTQLVLLEVCLHTIDVSNAARPWNAYRRWTRRIVDEFYQQGDAERQAGIPVTSIMDRHNQIPLEKFQGSFCFWSFVQQYCSGMSH